jgi:hypothetical protein
MLNKRLRRSGEVVKDQVWGGKMTGHRLSGFEFRQDRHFARYGVQTSYGTVRTSCSVDKGWPSLERKMLHWQVATK